MLKNYKELKVWQKACLLGLKIKEIDLDAVKENIAEIERILKALIKSLEKKTLPLYPSNP